MEIPTTIVPVVSVIEGEKFLHVQHYEGTGFWVTSAGHFLTCKHVVEHLVGDLKPVVAAPFGESQANYTPVLSVRAHPTYDLALCYVPFDRPRTLLRPYNGIVAMGLDVHAFAFMEPEKSGQSLVLNGRLLKGHVTRMYRSAERFPASSLMEVSFPCPRGFSGSPLLARGQLVGMIYGNAESKMQTFALEELDKAGNTYREVAYRVTEYGLAHPLDDVVSFLKQRGIKPFE